jgi:hypothetical protein
VQRLGRKCIFEVRHHMLLTPTSLIPLLHTPPLCRMRLSNGRSWRLWRSFTTARRSSLVAIGIREILGAKPYLPIYMVSFAAPRLLKRLPGCFAPGEKIVALWRFAKIGTFVAQGASPGMGICWSMCLAGVGGEVDLHWCPSCCSASGYVRGGFGYYIHLEIDSGPTDPKCRPRGPLRSPSFPFHSRRASTASPSPCLPCGCECWGYGLGQPPRTNICNGRRGFDRARTVYLIANRWSNTDQFPKLQRPGTCTTLNFRAVRRSYYRAFGAEHSESSTARAFNL